MLDPRIYRAALIPILFALIVGAFSLSDRPRPIGTTLEPDAFSASRAQADLDAWARAYPGAPRGRQRRRGARRQAGRRLPRHGLLSGQHALLRGRDRRRQAPPDHGHRAPGRPARPGPRGGRPPRRARAAARAPSCRAPRRCSSSRGWSRGGRLKRTVTFVSTSGGSAGLGGARDLAQRLTGRPGAVLVLGDLAGTTVRRPFVAGWSTGDGVGSLQLRRTVEAAVRKEAGTNPGGARATSQWARLAFPVTLGEQGPLVAGDLPAALHVGQRRAPAAGRRPDRARAGCRPSGARPCARSPRSTTRRRCELGGSTHALVTMRKVLPLWAVRLLVAALLLAPMLVAVDGFARVRRRHEPVGPWLWWILAAAAPIAARARLRLVPGRHRAAAGHAAGARGGRGDPGRDRRDGGPGGHRARRAPGLDRAAPGAHAQGRRAPRRRSAARARAPRCSSPGARWPPCCGCATPTPRPCSSRARTRCSPSSPPRCACAAASPSASSRSPPRRSCSSTCRSRASSGSRRPDFGWFCVLLVAGGVVGPRGLGHLEPRAHLPGRRAAHGAAQPLERDAAGDAADHRARPGQLRGPGLARRHRVRAAAMKRALGTALVVAGLLVLADAAATLAWQEPLSALRAGRAQHHLAAQLHALELAAPPPRGRCAPQLAIDARSARALAPRRPGGGRAAHRAHRAARRRRARDHARPTCARARASSPARRCPASTARRPSPGTARPTARRSGTSTRCAAATRSLSRLPYGTLPLRGRGPADRRARGPFGPAPRRP